jgi:hypothetical protein
LGGDDVNEPHAPEGTLKPWAATERESFFDAVARNQRAAVRLTITGWFCSALVALVVALLFAPIVFAIALLALDLINLVHPMSDPMRAAIAYFGHGARTTGAVPLRSWIEIGALLAAPGLLFIGKSSPRYIRRTAARPADSARCCEDA